MFNYQDYLSILCQLAHHPMARFKAGPWEVLVEKAEGQWRLSTPVFQAEEEIPSHVEACVSAAALLKWQEKISLTLDPLSASVHISQEVAPALYEAFRVHVRDFLSLAEEWHEIIADFALRD